MICSVTMWKDGLIRNKQSTWDYHLKHHWTSFEHPCQGEHSGLGFAWLCLLARKARLGDKEFAVHAGQFRMMKWIWIAWIVSWQYHKIDWNVQHGSTKVNPDKTFIESYTSIVPDITELANYNLGLAVAWIAQNNLGCACFQSEGFVDCQLINCAWFAGGLPH